MALANVAEHLYLQGFRVVMVDWDLEAPGLESFFFRAPDELKAARSQLGLMDVLLAYKRQFPFLSFPSGETRAAEITRILKNELPPLPGILYPIHGPDSPTSTGQAGLWLLMAGWRGGERFPEYVQAVQSFDWSDFYLHFHGEAFFEWMRGQLLNEMAADVVLIDSRTGATEMGGVTTHQLADVVVAFCVPNLQNLADTYMMTQSFLDDEITGARGRPVQVVVVPTRIENSEIDARNRFRDEFRATLDRFTPPTLKRVGLEFWDLKLPYIPKYAYLEDLAVGVPDAAEELENAYTTLAMNLAVLAPQESKLRALAAPILISTAPTRAASPGTESPPPLSNIPLARNPDFVGRDQLLAFIRGSLRAEDTAHAIVAITGLGGIGKTQLAVEYSYRFGADYDVIWWIRAADPAARLDDYARLAAMLSLPGHDSSDMKVVTQTVLRWLDHNTRWLLVFDDAKDPEDIGPYLPRGGFGDVLITSRNPNWRRLATMTVLDGFSADEAAQFILARTGQTDPVAAAELADALGDLPLALEQAAAYIEGTGLSLTEYLGLLGEHAGRILHEGEVHGYQGSVATTWSLSFERVRQSSPAAAELLDLIAFLGADKIPIPAIVAGAKALPSALARAVTDPLELNKVVAVLRSYSLVKADKDLLSVHRLVQAITRDQLDLPGKRRWAEAAIRVVQQAFPSGGRDPQQWPVCERMLGHALAAAGHAQDLGVGSAVASSLLDKVGVYLHARGEFSAARSALDRALALAGEMPGPHGRPLIEIGTNIGQLQLHTGRFHEALETMEPTMEMARQLYEPEESGYVRTVTALGAARLAVGETDGAAALVTKALPVAVRSLGQDHPDTIALTGNLAEVRRVQGDLLRARALQEQVLERRLKLLGPDHPDTLTAAAALAATLEASGELGEARPLRERVLERRQAVLGPDHPDTLAARGSIALWTSLSGDSAGALRLYQKLLPDLQRVLGPNQPDTLAVRDRIAALTGQSGEPAQAQQATGLEAPTPRAEQDESQPPVKRSVWARIAAWFKRVFGSPGSSAR